MTPHSADESAVLRKVTLRLIPFMALLYLVAFLDRVNVGFAALTMNRDIGLSATAYGLGAGIFFIGYFLFEVPSNAAESGPPTTFEMGTETRNMLITRARTADGNQ